MSRGVSEFLAALAGGLGGVTQGLQLNEQRRAADAERERQRRAEALQLLITRDQLGLVDEDPARHSFTAPAPSAAIRETIKASGLQDTLTPMLQSARPDTRQAVTVTDPISGQPMRLRLDPTQSAAGRARTAAREDAMSAFTREQGAIVDRERRQGAATAQERDTANRTAFATFQQMYPRDRLAREPYNPQVSYAPIIQRAQQFETQDRAFGQQVRLQNMADARARARAAAAGSGGGDYKDAMQLRGAYEGNQTVKEATEIANAVNVARRSARLGSGQGDNSLVYAAAKVFDPGSVVREGEFATIQRSASIPQQYRAQMMRAANGERLTPEMRSQLLRVVEERGQAVRDALLPTIDRYRQLAALGGVDPAAVIFDPFEATGSATPPAAPAIAQPAPIGRDGALGGMPVPVRAPTDSRRNPHLP